MVSKAVVIGAFVALFQENIERTKSSLEITRQNAVDAPGSNVSHSDTSKFQLSNLALGLEKRFNELTAIYNLLSLYNTSKINKRGCGGCLITLQNINTKENATYLLITREGGGDSLIVEEEKVIVVSIHAPIGKLLVGKEIGDEVLFQGKAFEIVDLQ